MWKSSEVVHVKAIINHSSVAMCRLEVVEILLIRFLFCSTAISQMCRHVTLHVCCTMSVFSRTYYTSHLWFNCSEQCTVRDISPLQCSTEAAMDAFFQDVFSRDSIIALLGSACPQSVQPIAELVHRWNISEVCQTKCLCVSESFRIFL